MTGFDAALAAEGFDLTGSEGLTKLVGEGRNGDFVHNSQVMASKDGFKNVSKLWFDKTLTYAQGLELLEKDRAKTHDIEATLRDITPTVNDKGQFAFLHRPSERYYVPTEHCLNQFGIRTDTGTWYINSLRENPTHPTNRNKEKYQRDRQDAETLVVVMRNALRRLDESKKFLFRTNDDGTLRAFLTDRFAVIDNRWFVELLSQLIPDGRLSHWKGDADDIFGNVLIPDTIREEADSDYGGMLSVGNSEIGAGRVRSLPSVFRAICMNGLVHGQTKGKGITQVHRGKIVLAQLAMEIKTNLELQIPLLPVGIDRFLQTKAIGWDGASISAKPVFAALAERLKLSKKQASAVLMGWNEENKFTKDLGHTLFGVINAITRAGQEFDNKTWVDFDEMGGTLMEDGDAGLKRILSRAKVMEVKEVEEAFA